MKLSSRSFLLLSSFLLLTGLLQGEPLRNPALAPHAQDMVVLKGDQLVSFDSARWPGAPYTILYWGAGWCPDCRHFSPSLVAAYDKQPAQARQFEVLLLSQDKTAEGMLQFMKTEKMNWPALAFDKLAAAHDLERFFSGHGIPCLTVIDRTGAVVLRSKDDQDANEILAQLQALLKNLPPK